jgi:hypothetical protein
MIGTRLGWGHVAEWLRSGLQNRLPRFNSGRGLQTPPTILELHADPAPVLPDNQAAFLGLAVQQDKALGDGGGVGNVEAGAARGKVNDTAVDRRGFGVDNDLRPDRHQARRPDPCKSSIFASHSADPAENRFPHYDRPLLRPAKFERLTVAGYRRFHCAMQ